MTDRDHMDRRLAAALDQVLTDQIQHDLHHDTITRPAEPPLRRRTVWVTASVGLVVVLLAAVSINLAADRHQGSVPATTTSSSLAPDGAATPTIATATATAATLLKKLPKQPYGKTIHTWTDRDSAAATPPFTVPGRTVVMAAVCSGPGAIAVTDTRGKPRTFNCHKLSVQGPYWQFNLGGDQQPTTSTRPVHLEVRVLTGQPRYIVRAWAVDPRILRDGMYIAKTSSTVPISLRTCNAGDLATTGAFTRLPDVQGGVITITSRSATDCAIRTWPALRYLNAAGTRIGGTAGMSLDSREGKADKYHEFPPALLRAGGKAYLIADLFTEERLKDNDRQQQDAPAPTPSLGSGFPKQKSCDPVRVSALQLTVAGTVITVAAPASPAVATCSNTSYIFGVNPVVAMNPAGR